MLYVINAHTGVQHAASAATVAEAREIACQAHPEWRKSWLVIRDTQATPAVISSILGGKPGLCFTGVLGD